MHPLIFAVMLALQSADSAAQITDTSRNGAAVTVEPAQTRQESPNVTDWIVAASAAVTAVVSIILLRQLSLLRTQVSLTKDQVTSAKDQLVAAKDQLHSGVQWNKLNAAFTYYNSDLVMAREKEAAMALERAGVNFYKQRTPLTPEQLDIVYTDMSIYVPVRTFINLMEDYCTAVRIGAIDEDAAFSMNSSLIMRWYTVFEPFIDRQRVETGDAESLCELEKLAKDWQAKDDERLKAHEQELRDAGRRVAARLGVQKKL